MQKISKIRHMLVDAKIRASKQATACEEARQTVLAGVDYKELGSNETARKLALDALMAEDAPLAEALYQQKRIEHDIMRLEADLEAAIDERRAHEWSIRAKLADTLAIRFGVDADDHHAFDAPLDEEVWQASVDEIFG